LSRLNDLVRPADRSEYTSLADITFALHVRLVVDLRDQGNKRLPIEGSRVEVKAVEGRDRDWRSGGG